MEIDINERVLAAFQVEHREHLEQIRSLLQQLPCDSDVAGDARLQDAFRLVHSLKGGARVSDLRPVEQLGHGLETILDQLNQGRLSLENDVVSSITTVLDSIEDWMIALAREEACPDTNPAMNSIEHVLGIAENPSADSPSPDENRDLEKKLRDAFRNEFFQNIDRLRSFADAAQHRDGEQIDFAEPTRIFHTLAGAARVVNCTAVEKVAGSLETKFRQDILGTTPGEPAVWQTVAACIEALKSAYHQDDQKTRVSASPTDRPVKAAANVFKHKTSQTSASSVSARSPATAPWNPATPAQQETLRVSVHSLDRLLRSSGELVVEGQRREQFTREFESLHRDIDDLDRQRESIRHLAASDLHRLAELPAFDRISRYMEYFDRQVHLLARRVQALCLAHQRNAWMLRIRSQQLHRHVCESRMVPVDSMFQGLRKMVRDLAKEQGKQINLEVRGFDIRADRRVLQSLRDPIIHMLRNCVTHGIELPDTRVRIGKPESGHVVLDVRIAGNHLQIIVDDDGSGIDVERLVRRATDRNLIDGSRASQRSAEELAELVFSPGLSTTDTVTELAGRGMGLSIVQEAVARLKGSVHCVRKEGSGTRFRISVPTSLYSHRLVIVTCGQQRFAVPLHGIDRLLRVKKDDVKSVEGRPVVMYRQRPVPLVRLETLLGISVSASAAGDALSTIVIKSGSHRVAVCVDALVEERDALVQDLDAFARTRALGGAVLLEDGGVALVVSPSEVVMGFRPAQTLSAEAADPVNPAASAASVRVLVVDDSFTTRTLEKSILEAHGYQVHVAVDGAEALSYLRHDRCDLVITDIEMPRMDGFTLLGEIKADCRLAHLPVILVTSRDQPTDRQHGLDLGADAYIVKRKFDHQDLLETIEQVL